MTKPEKNLQTIARDVSWMYFNHRILREAQRPDVPLLERMSFLGIYSNNLDEFFRVRVASLSRIVQSGARRVGTSAVHEARQAIEQINAHERPLALYLFSDSREDADRVWTRCHFGGGCVNDTLSHLINPRLPFGGVGQSGLGCYHGRWGFETFSHPKSQLVRMRPDVPLRYPPFAKKGWVRNILGRLVG